MAYFTHLKCTSMITFSDCKIGVYLHQILLKVTKIMFNQKNNTSRLYHVPTIFT